MAEFDLAERRVRLILQWVHQLQCATLLIVGALLAAAPRGRFGHAWSLMFELPGSRYVLAVVYLLAGVAAAWALRSGDKRRMALALRCGGVNTLAMALLLIAGSFVGPTGVLVPVLAAYVGLHLTFQSLLMNDKT